MTKIGTPNRTGGIPIISEKVIKQAIDYSNLSQWIQNEIMDYMEDNNNLDLVEVADRIIKRVLEDKNLVNNKIHKEGFDAGYKKGIKIGREAGVLSTYPVVNLDDDYKNCELCGHDHSLASKDCRCYCCVVSSKGLLPYDIKKKIGKLFQKKINNL